MSLKEKAKRIKPIVFNVYGVLRNFTSMYLGKAMYLR